MRTAQDSTWRLAVRLAGYRPWQFLFAFLLFGAASSSMLLVGWMLQQIFDLLGGDRPVGWGVYTLVAALAAVEAARLGAAWGGVLREIYFDRLRGLVRLNLMRAQMATGRAEAGTLPRSSGEAVSRFRDDVNDFIGFIDIALFVAGELLFAVGAVAVMLTIDPLITICVLLPLATVVVTTRAVSGRIRRRRAVYREASAAVTGLLGEMFGAVLAVKTAHAGRAVVARLAEFDLLRHRAGLRDRLVTQMLDTFSRVTVSVSLGAVLLLAVATMPSGELTVGDFALFLSYVGTLVAMPRYTGRLLAGHRQAGVAVDRMRALLPDDSATPLVAHRPLTSAAPPAVPSAVPSAGPAIRSRSALRHLEVRNLIAVHPGSGRGIRGVDLTVTRGSFTVITGPAGAGKTTLLRAIIGLMPIQAGDLAWNGEQVLDRGELFVPPRCAYVPQVPRLFSESLQDNVLLGTEPAALAMAVQEAAFDDDVAVLPDGLDTLVGARGVRLSGGQIQRAAVARALVRRSDLLVLDDVSSALDGHTERQLWDGLLARTDSTLLVVSNRPATIGRADQVIRIENGRIEESGSSRLQPGRADTAA